MAGTAISAGLVVPAVSGIPYIGWLASGWAMLLGNKVGSELGSEIGANSVTVNEFSFKTTC